MKSRKVKKLMLKCKSTTDVPQMNIKKYMKKKVQIAIMEQMEALARLINKRQSFLI